MLHTIHILGLVIGIASVFLLSKYIGYFLTLDDFHENKERVYGVHQWLRADDTGGKYSKSTYNGVAPLVKAEFPAVQAMSRYITTAETLVTVKDSDGRLIKYNENHISEVDPDFLSMFTISFLHGDIETALDEPNSIVLSESMARKYFGEEEAVGRTLTTTKSWGEKRIWTVMGVFEDYPLNSKFKFDALQSMVDKEFEVSDRDWAYPYFKSYLLLDDMVDSKTLASDVSAYVNGIPGFQEGGKKIEFQLVNIQDESSLTDGQRLLIAVGVVLLLVTWINYTNLSGAHALSRGREYGVRKVLGSSKSMLVRQFLQEAIFTYTLAIGLAISLMLVVHPFIVRVGGGQILSLMEWDSYINILFPVVLVVGSLVSAAVPSFSISSSSAMRLIKHKGNFGGTGQLLRRTLVVFQLIVAVVMLVGVITIYQQMQYMQNRDLGINTDQTIILKAPKDDWGGKMARLANFKHELRQLSFTKQVSSSTTVPMWRGGAPTDYEVGQDHRKLRLYNIGTDLDYFHGYDLTLIAGEYFRKGQFKQNREVAIINETALSTLGYNSADDVLNERLLDKKTNKYVRVVGVVKDHHNHSLHKQIQPLIFTFNPFRGFISIHLDLSESTSARQVSAVMSHVETTWDDIYPNQAFDYYFLDARLSEIYEDERLFQKVFLSFTAIALFITFLGIFGLSMFIAQQRRKEMGIRKVVGAGFLTVLGLFCRGFIVNVGWALVIGAPVAYHLMNLWLDNFSYHIRLNIWMFVLSYFSLIFLTVISLVFHGLKIANVNPAHVLKDE